MTPEFSEGYDARLNSKGVVRCPYVIHTEEAIEWTAGWLACDKNLNHEHSAILLANYEAS